MPRYIIKIKEKYFEWSTVVDSPVTFGMGREEFTKHYLERYGDWTLEKLKDRLARTDETGCSSPEYASLDDLISLNRAGPKETSITKDQIFERYAGEDE